MEQSFVEVSGTKSSACSFCGKTQAHVARLITGPAVFICNECVWLSMQILREEGIEAETRE